MGRESKVKPELPKLDPVEIARRYEQAQGVNQELHAVERKLGQRIGERAELKAKLDKLSDDIKSKQEEADRLRIEISQILDGTATGRLPFGTAEVVDGKPRTPADLKMKPAEIAEALYPDLVGWVQSGKVPPVNRACAVPGHSLRYVVVPAGDAKHKDRYLMIPLHEGGWNPPSSHAVIPDITAKAVEFMEKAYLLGTRDECVLVEAKLPKPKPSTAKNGNPGEATRGAARKRALAELGTKVDEAILRAIDTGKVDRTSTLEAKQAAVCRMLSIDLEKLEELTLGQLTDATSHADSLAGDAVARALNECEASEHDEAPAKKRGRKPKKK